MYTLKINSASPLCILCNASNNTPSYTHISSMWYEESTPWGFNNVLLNIHSLIGREGIVTFEHTSFIQQNSSK